MTRNYCSYFPFFRLCFKKRTFKSKHIYKIVQKNNDNLLLFEMRHWLTPYLFNYDNLNTNSPKSTNKTAIQKNQKSEKSEKSEGRKKIRKSFKFQKLS